ncbi:MAG: MFS transporter, partial [Actinobacteria bacterium HGW-Actinobacteria-8]
MVGFSALALAATGPGQTVGISLFIDPLIEELGVSRSSISTSYLLGTLAGAIALPWIGRALDRYGVRRTMAVIGFVFGAVLIALSLISSVVGL